MVICVVYFDSLSDFSQDEKLHGQCWEVWSRKYPGIAKRVRWTITDNLRRFHELIPGTDYVFFDYGGLLMLGHEMFGLSFARELEKHIVDRPSIDFITLCTMGKDWYEDDFFEEHPNLHFEEPLWHDLFDKYLGDIEDVENRRNA
jgi:hypothetical protein